ncbi:MAG: Homoserine dehydrogenase (EC [uncultured Thiotrichaceae bacterium]|uniref:Homoserine dehydrogenase n=1 Tax=uncultured Thiotrichaceae bacterium TaxID=298394 RepID=A0A6S6TBR8_9GAMM|nr:MAG: Homoserine dehydrogenase (EC [uncultured Thiotrichaceae bacterium]
MKPVKVGLLGLGTVGGGTATVLSRNAEEIARRAGRGIVIDYAAALDTSNADQLGLTEARLSNNALEVVHDPDIDIVVELIGGYTLAKDLVMTAIENGKHVVTANKALIALHGNEIFAAAEEKNVMVAFEAGVAGGIPVIKAVREGLAANHIEWLAGIINGTGNFILTEMLEKGRDFADVLREAQELGYAEADPTFDVEGIDAAHKLTILSSLAFGIPLQFDKTYTEGIAGITAEDVTYAGELGYNIKHLGVARRTEQGIEQRVHPTMIPKRRLIANVNGVMNAVLVHGDAVGPTLYYGAGAGAEPTASAVVADIIDVVRAMTSDPNNRVPHLAFQPSTLADTPILSIDDVETAFYLRMRAADRPGVLADVTRILGDRDISIEAFIQKEPAAGEQDVDIIMLTQRVREGNMNEAIATIEALDTIDGNIARIRVESLG